MSDWGEHIGKRDDDDLVAAEYVLGVLDLAERADVARRVETDAAFARLVADWEIRLSDLNADFSDADPPAAVWQAVEERLFETGTAPARQSAGLWANLAFWRVLSFGSFAAAAALALFIFATRPVELPAAQYVASLSSPETDAQFVAVTRPDGTLAVTRTGIEAPPDRNYELWVISGDDAPISLGVLASSGATSTSVPAQYAGLEAETLTFAVSVEPAGGSPTGAPTGPVVAAGNLKKI